VGDKDGSLEAGGDIAGDLTEGGSFAHVPCCGAVEVSRADIALRVHERLVLV
jgi:hypothetical protein